MEIMKRIPINFINEIHLKSLNNFGGYESNNNFNLFELGFHRVVARFLNHISYKVVLISVELILNIISLGSPFNTSNYSSKINHELDLPEFFQNPLFDQL